MAESVHTSNWSAVQPADNQLTDYVTAEKAKLIIFGANFMKFAIRSVIRLVGLLRNKWYFVISWILMKTNKLVKKWMFLFSDKQQLNEDVWAKHR